MPFFIVYKDIWSGRKAQEETRKFYANFIASHKMFLSFFSPLSSSPLSPLIAYKFQIIHQKADVEASSWRIGRLFAREWERNKNDNVLLRKIFRRRRNKDRKQPESNLISSTLLLASFSRRDEKHRNRFLYRSDKVFLSSRKLL